jgi:hypothetical protein
MDAQAVALNQMSNSLVQEQSQIISILTNAQEAVAESAKLNAKFNSDFDWVLTNLANLKFKDDVATSMEDARQKSLHGKIDPISKMRWSITNTPNTMNPATGLPWQPGEK